MGTSSCQVVSRLPSGVTWVWARLDSWWVCNRETAAAASLSRVSRSPSSSAAWASRDGRGKLRACWRALAWPRAPRALRMKAGSAWAMALLVPVVGRLEGVGRAGSSWPIRRSRLALRSWGRAPAWPASRRDSSRAPLFSRAWASTLGSPSWRMSGRAPSSRSTVPRRFSGSLSRPMARRASCRASSEPWRLCWAANCWVSSSWSNWAASGRNCSIWLPWTWALRRLPIASGRGLSMLSWRPASGVLSRLTRTL
ncbi:hypothetical protein D3C72_1633130 [compost metagenome]